ncbi:MAG: hypothetical protein KDJ34_18345 [Candidatus Competibacteraceae bacterium]|nr:hypothetical protein [Candidatus Competibacteraceae bacterium]MCP5133656.1 hypothetical protein [Gammaproteobacteria bacterium]
MIVIGLGSGRTGTASLARLIDSQPHALCFHELNPAGAVFAGNPQPVCNTIREFQAILAGGDKRLLALDYTRPMSVKTYTRLQTMNQVRILGDIAFYYLRYIDDLLSITDNIRFICIRRDKQETVESWLEKSSMHRWRSLWIADWFKSLITRTPFHRSKNFWQEHDGTEYQPDPVWDKTFPKFEAVSKREAIEKYWDYYYAEAEQLATQHPEHFRIFDISEMSHPAGQKNILGFIGIPKHEMVLRDKFHEHQSGRK